MGPQDTTGTYRSPTSFEPPPMSSGGGFGQGVQGRWGSDSHSQQSSFQPAMHKDPGALEFKLVDELCAPGGARVAPSDQALKDFCRKCESLEAKVISDALVKKLAQPDWQTRLKALYAIESLANNNL